MAGDSGSRSSTLGLCPGSPFFFVCTSLYTSPYPGVKEQTVNFPSNSFGHRRIEAVSENALGDHTCILPWGTCRHTKVCQELIYLPRSTMQGFSESTDISSWVEASKTSTSGHHAPGWGLHSGQNSALDFILGDLSLKGAKTRSELSLPRAPRSMPASSAVLPVSDSRPTYAGTGVEDGDGHGLLWELKAPFADRCEGAAGEKVWREF